MVVLERREIATPRTVLKLHLMSLGGAAVCQDQIKDRHQGVGTA